MIRLKLIHLIPRKNFTPVVGRKQSLYRALVICMLPEEGLFTASDVAATAWSPITQSEEYRYQRQKIYDLAHNHGLPNSPDNLDENGEILPGERGRKQRPKWSAMSWREILTDEVYQEAVDFFENLHRIDVANRRNGKTFKYFYDEAQGLIEKEIVPPNPKRFQPRAGRSPHISYLKVFGTSLLLLFAFLLISPWLTNSDLKLLLGNRKGIEDALHSQKTRKSILGPGSMSGVYSQGLRVLNHEGPRAALEYFRSATFDRKDYKAEFGQAWSKFVIGDFAEAEEDCHRLLAFRDLPDPLRGNCNYLLGYLQMPTNRLSEAKENFRTAAEIYEKHRQWQNFYKTSLALGKVAMEQGFLDEAEATFHQAFTMNRPIDRNLGFYYFLQAKLAFHRENYTRALQLARKGLFESEKDGKVNEQADSLCEIGFYLMLVGDFQAGYEVTMEAQEIIQKIGDQRKYYFNLVNLILLNKCRGEPLSPLLEQVESRIAEEGPGHLATHLEFVLDWVCVPEIESEDHFGGKPETGGEGDAPPPPDQQ